MDYKQKAADYSIEFSQQLKEHGNQEKDSNVFTNILSAMTDGISGCVCYFMPDHVRQYLEDEGFLVVYEVERDTAYYIVSWGEQIIA